MTESERPVPLGRGLDQDVASCEREVAQLALLALAADRLAERADARPEHDRAPGWQERSAALHWAVAAAQARLRGLVD